MWTRRQLKEKAKSVLQTSYWKAFLVSIILAFAGSSDQPQFSFNYSFNSLFPTNTPLPTPHSTLPAPNPSHLYNNWELYVGIFLFVFIIALIIIAVALCFRIFLGYPLEVGGKRFFIRLFHQQSDLNYIGFGFSNGHYKPILKAMIWKDFCLFLWYLLFFIPGIIKSYSYRMTPYILADNPHIGYKRALKLSMQMTHGSKWKMFVLDLSFIGWYLLGLLALFVGMIFVVPYQLTTNGALYVYLRNRALDIGFATYEELGFKPPIAEESFETPMFPDPTLPYEPPIFPDLSKPAEPLEEFVPFDNEEKTSAPIPEEIDSQEDKKEEE